MNGDEESRILDLDAQIISLKLQVEALIAERNNVMITYKKRRSSNLEDDEPITKKTKTTSVDEGISVNPTAPLGDNNNLINLTTPVGEFNNIGLAKSPTKDENAKNKNEEWKKAQNKRVPPIYLYEVSDWTSVSSLIKNLCAEDFFAKTGPDYIKVQLKNADDYRTITKFLDVENIQNHTYLMDRTPVLKAVIKGIPPSTGPEVIEKELQELKLDCKVKQLRGKNQTMSSLFLVTLGKTEQAKEIFSVKRLCHCSVKIESYKKRESLTQCFRCQRFGHTRLTCQISPKCVKCAGDHLAAECLKSPKSPASCINCGGQHPASYKQCPYYLKLKEKSVTQKLKNKPRAKEIANKFTPRMTNEQPAPVRHRMATSNQTPKQISGNNPSYAQVTTSGREPTLEQKVNNMMVLLNKICQKINIS